MVGVAVADHFEEMAFFGLDWLGIRQGGAGVTAFEEGGFSCEV